MKELRQMGFKYNLGADALCKQDSLSLVLSSTNFLTGINVERMDYYFHKTVTSVLRSIAVGLSSLFAVVRGSSFVLG